jgi:hypothetical protein
MGCAKVSLAFAAGCVTWVLGATSAAGLQSGFGPCCTREKVEKKMLKNNFLQESPEMKAGVIFLVVGFIKDVPKTGLSEKVLKIKYLPFCFPLPFVRFRYKTGRLTAHYSDRRLWAGFMPAAFSAWYPTVVRVRKSMVPRAPRKIPGPTSIR